MAADPDHPGNVKIAVLEEHAAVEKHAVTTGKVSVVTRTESFEEVARATLSGESVDVVRVPIDQPVVGAPPQIRTEGDLTIVPIFEEQLVIETRLVLKEELHIRKRATSETVEIPVTLRRQHAEVERS